MQEVDHNKEGQKPPPCHPSAINLNADVDGEPTVIELDHPEKPIGFRCPIRLYVVGPSQSGKSRLVQGLVEEMPDWFDVKFRMCFYLHPASELSSGIRNSHIQPLQTACAKYDVPFRNISANTDEFLRQLERMDQQHRLLIIDDMQTQITDSPKWADVFVRLSHHIFLSVILISQNFYSGKHGPAIRRNCTEFVLFKSLRDKNYIANIANDLLRGNVHFLEKCFTWLAENMQDSYSRYIVIDRNEGSDPHLPRNHLAYFGVKTNLFKNPETGQRQVVYFPCSSLM